jgi:hypothetical protein
VFCEFGQSEAIVPIQDLQNSMDFIADVQRIEKAIGSIKVKEEHFADFL